MLLEGEAARLANWTTKGGCGGFIRAAVIVKAVVQEFLHNRASLGFVPAGKAF